jgi:diguanylate cyclase (GGDEF)-like protein
MLGISSDAVASTVDEWFGRIHPDDRGRVQSEIGSHVEGITAHFSSEHRLLHNDGTYRWMQFRGLAVRDVSGKALRMAGSMTDITDRKEAEKRLVFEALHDSLTGLPNRALFMDRLKHAIDHSRRSADYLFAVLFMDLDRFKILNDSMGHAAGDEMLMAVSGRLQECLRDCDTVSRFGGDEFAILLENLRNENEALHIVRRIQEKIGRPFSICGQDIYTSASIGIVFSSSGSDSADTLLRNADIAMYHAKADGSIGYGVFNSEMYADAVSRLEMETDLRVAVKNHEFRLLYQPVISVGTGRLVGFESLLRWDHPVHGMLGPEHFIRIAEDTGVIVDIGEWVIAEACRQLSEWQRLSPADPPLSISVNISSKQLFPGLVRHVRDGIGRNLIRPGSLILELTESMMMENRETVISLLSDMKKMNVRIHIDDFGTGYSSLSYLNDLPVDVLKIDRSFICRLGRNGEGMEIVRAITTLARSLGMGIIAEGVENDDQVFRLRGLGCDHMQGYYFSVPLEPEQAEGLIGKAHSCYPGEGRSFSGREESLFLKTGKVSE